MQRLYLDIYPVLHCLFLSSPSFNSLPAIKQPTNHPKKNQENTHEVVFKVLGGIH